MFRSAVLYVLLASVATVSLAQSAVDYDVVYVRQPRYGDNVNTIWPEVFHPARAEPGADLMLLHPDGSEELLVEGGNGSVTDPFVSFDAQWVYYSFFYDLRPESLNGQRGDLPNLGADIFRIHLESRRIEQLTFGEFTPNTGAGNWDESDPLDAHKDFNRLGYGILNLGPCPLPGGRIAFTSNRNGFEPPKGYTSPTLQLFVMDEDGSNITQIAPMNIGSALHPVPLRDGRLMFSSYESQGLRDERLWGIWAINPDGRNWAPLASAYKNGGAFHFSTQMSNEDIVMIDYYNLNNNGFGAAYRFPIAPPAGIPPFYSAFLDDNPEIEKTNSNGDPSTFQMPFTPWGMHSISPFTHGSDNAAAVGSNGVRVGKLTQPSAAPDGELLVVWTPGPANDLERPEVTPQYDGGLYLIPASTTVSDPGQLITLKNDPAYNESWPRAVVPYGEVHGVEEPVELEWLPNDGSLHVELPAGTPHGLVGTSSFYRRESFPGIVNQGTDSFDGLDAFNTGENDQSSNWYLQGAEAGKYTSDDIYAVRVVAMEPNSHRSYGPNEGRQFHNFANERLRILGEIPLRKDDGAGGELLDPDGNPDTSFLAKLPADTPFTFQTLDQDGLVLNMAQTWHQVRPGEMRADCGGCHAHSQLPLDFAETAAADPGYEVPDLGASTPLLSKDASGNPTLIAEPTGVVDVEFYRDIRPILERSCISCHTSSDPEPPGNLVLDDWSTEGDLPGDYFRLAEDFKAVYGHPPVISNDKWRQTNASRYIRKFQSRRSLLIWKIFGRRLDGWTNADHPTETVPGDASTLPEGVTANSADLDYTGSIMPPPGSGAPSLTEDEKMLFARWVDLGAPINSGEADGSGDYGWFLDDLRPTIELSLPRPGYNSAPVTELRLGLADVNSGLDLATLSVRADFELAGQPAESELSGLLVDQGDGIWTLPLNQPLGGLADRHIFVEVADVQGNITRLDREFTTEPSFQLSVSVAGDWTGVISDGEGSIDCGFFCEASYPSGTSVALEVTPDPGGRVESWNAECPGGVVQMDQDRSCVVTLVEVPCAADQEIFLSESTVTTTQTITACSSIRAGDDYRIESPGDLTLSTRGTIIFENGFSVGDGSKLSTEINPMAGVDVNDLTTY